MLTNCPQCGQPVCANCGNHVSHGALGAPSVANLAKAAVAQAVYRPVANLVGWKSSMAPTWNGTYEAYWLQRMDAFLRRYSDDGSGIAKQWRALPDYWDRLRKLIYWYASPSIFLARYKPLATNPSYYIVPGVWYAEPWHAQAAANAASDAFLDLVPTPK